MPIKVLPKKESKFNFLIDPIEPPAEVEREQPSPEDFKTLDKFLRKGIRQKQAEASLAQIEQMNPQTSGDIVVPPREQRTVTDVAETFEAGVRGFQRGFQGVKSFFTEAIPAAIDFSKDVGETLKAIGEAGVKFITQEETQEKAKTAFRSGELQTAAGVGSVVALGLKKVGLDQLSNSLNKIAERDIELSDALARSNIDVQDTRKFTEQIKDPDFIVAGLAQNLPNMLAAMGLSAPAAAVGAPAGVLAGLGFLGAATIEGGAAINEAKSLGITNEATLSKVAAMVGIANGILETIPLNDFLTRNPAGGKVKGQIIKNITRRIVRQAALEAGTEGLQEIVANAVATTYDENRDILQGVPESLFFGGLTGGLLSGAGDVGKIVIPKIGLTVDIVTDEITKDTATPIERASRTFKNSSSMQLEATGFKTDSAKVKNMKTDDLTTFDELQSRVKDTVSEEAFKAKAVTSWLGSSKMVFDLFTSKLEKQNEAKVSEKQIVKENIFKEHIKDEPDAKPAVIPEVEKEVFPPEQVRIIDQKKLDPERVRSRIEDDLALKINKTILGDFKTSPTTPIAQKVIDLLGTTLKEVDSPGKFFSEVVKVIKADKTLTKQQRQEMIKDTAETTRDFFIIDKWLPLGDKVLETKKLREELSSFVDTKEIDFAITKAEEIVKAAEIKPTLTTKQQIEKAAKIKPTEKEARVTKKEAVLLKDRIKNIARGVREGRVQTKKEIKSTQSEVIDILEKSKLEAKDRDKFRRAIKNVQTKEQLQKALPEIQERITELETRADVRKLKTKIKEEIKATKPKKQAGKPVGKFTAEIQQTLDIFRKTIDLGKQESLDRLINNFNKFENGKMPIEVAMENKIIELLNGTPQELQSLLNDIVQMKEKGKTLTALKEFNIQAEISRKKSVLIDQITAGQGLPEGVQTTGQLKKTTSQKLKSELKAIGKKWVVSWNGLMDILDFNAGVANQKLAKVFSVQKQENKYKELQFNFTEDFNALVSDSYGIENKPTKIHKKITDSEEVFNLGTFENSVGQKVEIELTKGEAMKRFAEFKDPTLLESFEEGNNFTKEIKDAIVGVLTPQDKKFVDGAMELFKKQREIISPVFSKINGINLPDNPFYSPIKRVGFEVSTEKGLGEFIEEATYRKAVTSSSLKSRVKTLLPIEKQNIIEVLERHFKETNYYVAWAEQIRELDTIFKDQKIRFLIEDQYTQSVKSAIDNTINDLATNGNKLARRSGALDWFRKHFTVGALMAKPSLAAKQYVSTLAYGEVLTPKQFVSGVADFWKHPVRNTKTLIKESTLIKTRGENIERDIKAALKSDVFEKYSSKQNLINGLMLNVKIGDKGAILTGSWAMRRAALNKGTTLKEAISEYEKFSAETQQSSDLSQLSEVQRGGSFEQLFTMFKSSQRQYLAKEVNAVKSIFQDGGFSKTNIKKVAKTIGIYHFLLPMMFQYVSNFGGWDEEDKKEYLRAGILGSLNGLFIAGDMVDSIIRSAMGLRVWDLDIPITNVVNNVNNAIKDLNIGDIEDAEVFEAIKDLTLAGNALGVPVRQAANIREGISRVMDGDIKNGMALIAGWTEFSLGLKRKKPKPKTKIKIRKPKVKVKKVKLKFKK
jgi:hypothetical protein